MTPLCLLLWACIRRLPEPQPLPTSDPPPAPVVSAGRIVEGRYIDARWGFSILVPEGVTARIGRDDGSIRLSLLSDRTRTLLELWVFAGSSESFRPRADCRWDFVDTARYRALGGTRPLTVGTCTPLDPAGPLTQGWLIPGPQATVQAEAHLPPGAVLEGRQESEAILRGLRWEDGEPVSGG